MEKLGLSDVTSITQQLYYRRGDTMAHMVRIKAVTCLFVTIFIAFSRKLMKALWKAVSLR